MLQIFPSSSLIQYEYVPSDLQNDFSFLVEFIKSQLLSAEVISPNQRIRSAIKTITSSRLDLLELFVDHLRRYITSLVFDSVESFSASFLVTIDKCRHMANLLQFNYPQSQLLSRSCYSTYQSIFTELNLMDEVSRIFESTLFSGNNEKLLTITTLLRNLSLTDSLEEVIIKLTTDHVSKKISKDLSGEYKGEMKPLLMWSSNTLYPILERFLPRGEFTEDMLHELIRSEVVKLRTNEVFEMVSEFPSSTRALNELRFSISSQSQREQLINRFYLSCNSRLLHAGTDTITIIQYYMKTVRSFLVIDPRGVLLDKACRPIRSYLKTREDTMEKIVNGLLDTQDDSVLHELNEELYNTKTNSIDVDDINDANWMPDPIDALPDFRNKKVGDLIESLFSIFDSKSSFLDALFKRFSRDLTNLTDYDVRQMVLSLNFLKLRFGEEDFNSVDVMVQGVVQSAMIDSKINPGTSSFHTTVISHLYWPLDEFLDDYPAPSFLKQTFDDYSTRFGDIKRGRKLKLIPSLGTVDLDLEFEDGKIITYNVSPDKAAVVYAFSGQTEMNLEQLMKTLLMDSDDLEDILKFWVAEDVLYEVSPQVYALNEHKTGETEAL